MKKTWCLVVLALLAVLATAQSVDQPVTPLSAVGQGTENARVKIGAFNVQIFGPTKLKKPNTMTVLAEIASTFDVLALEEVGSNSSRASDETCVAVMNAYVDRINKLVGKSEFSYVRGNQYAILYRTDEFAVVSSALYEGTQAFTYQPLTAYLRSKIGNLDFAMLVIHTSPGKARLEIPELKTAIAEVSKTYNEPDVMCLGDFNADGSYFSEGDTQDLNGFSEPSYISAIPNSSDTTVATSSNTYDRIELTGSMASDFDSKWGVVHFGELWDVSKCEGTAKTAGTESAVSDHYPVWAEFYIDRDSDSTVVPLGH